MGVYVLRRLIQAIPLLFAILLFSFIIVHVAPGGPAGMMMNPRITPVERAILMKQYGLNLPLSVQFEKWIWAVLHLNFGYSYVTQQPVIQMIAQTLPNTLVLMGAVVLVSFLLAFPLGIYSATHQYSKLDYCTTVLNYAGISMPDFWTGTLIMMLFTVIVPIFPVSGMYSVTATYSNTLSFVLSVLYHMVLPVSVLVFVSIAGWTRYLRAQMLETIREDYIRTARAKGVAERRVIWGHALHNAILPVVTLLGVNLLPMLFGGAVITETIFNWPGMGRLLYTSALERDYPVILAGVVIGGALTIIGNLLADVVYALIDPRISYN